MSDFSGFQCNECNQVWTLELRTRVTMKFEENAFCELGTWIRDLCPVCIGSITANPPQGWEKVVRRKKNATVPSVPEVVS